jgi:hypothetical protein
MLLNHTQILDIHSQDWRDSNRTSAVLTLDGPAYPICLYWTLGRMWDTFGSYATLDTERSIVVRDI